MGRSFPANFQKIHASGPSPEEVMHRFTDEMGRRGDKATEVDWVRISISSLTDEQAEAYSGDKFVGNCEYFREPVG